MFADDVKVYLQIAGADDVADCSIPSTWLPSGQMNGSFSVSIAKCVWCPAQFHIHDIGLPHLSHCSDLGVVITSDLSCSLHIQQICVQAHQCANSICVVLCLGMVKLLLRAFSVYVRLMLEYNHITSFEMRHWTDIKSPSAVYQTTLRFLPRDAMCKRGLPGVRPSVCLSRSCILSRRLKISSHFFLGPVQHYSIFDPRRRYLNPRETSSTGAQNRRRVGIFFGNFRLKSPSISEKVRDRPMITMKRY